MGKEEEFSYQLSLLNLNFMENYHFFPPLFPDGFCNLAKIVILLMHRFSEIIWDLFFKLYHFCAMKNEDIRGFFLSWNKRHDS